MAWPRQCANCGKQHIENRSDRRVKFCSRKCAGQANKGFWKESTEEQKMAHRIKAFEKYVVKKDGCWDWSGSIIKHTKT
jgi:endogenous inhibitor of DNA gyrase (YacG/DUF329 family)